MSDIPEVDISKVNAKLVAKVSSLQHLVIQLETLAEQLRDERDEARQSTPPLEGVVQ